MTGEDSGSGLRVSWGIAFLAFGIVALTSSSLSHTLTVVTSVLGFLAVVVMITLFIRGTLTRWRLRQEAAITTEKLREHDS